MAIARKKCVREQEGRSKEGSPKEEKGVLKSNCFEQLFCEHPLYNISLLESSFIASIFHATVLLIPL